MISDISIKRHGDKKSTVIRVRCDECGKEQEFWHGVPVYDAVWEAVSSLLEGVKSAGWDVRRWVVLADIITVHYALLCPDCRTEKTVGVVDTEGR